MYGICKLQSEGMWPWSQLYVGLLLTLAIVLVRFIKLNGLACWKVFTIDVDMEMPTSCRNQMPSSFVLAP